MRIQIDPRTSGGGTETNVNQASLPDQGGSGLLYIIRRQLTVLHEHREVSSTLKNGEWSVVC